MHYILTYRKAQFTDFSAEIHPTWSGSNPTYGALRQVLAALCTHCNVAASRKHCLVHAFIPADDALPSFHLSLPPDYSTGCLLHPSFRARFGCLSQEDLLLPPAPPTAPSTTKHTTLLHWAHCPTMLENVSHRFFTPDASAKRTVLNVS
jgi:hypothetical protein